MSLLNRLSFSTETDRTTSRELGTFIKIKKKTLIAREKRKTPNYHSGVKECQRSLIIDKDKSGNHTEWKKFQGIVVIKVI